MQFPKLLVISLAILLMHACKEDSCLQSSDTFISARSEIPDTIFAKSWTSQKAELTASFTYPGFDGCDQANDLVYKIDYSKKEVAIQAWVHRKGCQCTLIAPVYQKSLTLYFDPGHQWIIRYPNSSLAPDTFYVK
ncbi:MAG: hypothetical protein LCH37_09395 [Bacteroidetes bacterium]|nr:hypothetical protein [Bacteroidota bacterium]